MKSCCTALRVFPVLFLSLLMPLIASCQQAREFDLLPYPQQITRLDGTLQLGPASYLISGPSATTAIASSSMSSYLSTSGPSVTVRLGSVEEGYDSGWLTADENAFLADAATSSEASIIKVGANGITIVGKGKWGMLYGVQTVNQLVRSTTTRQGIWQMRTSLPYVVIRDWPDMKWRCLSPQMTWYSGYNRLEGYDNGNWTLDEWKWLVDWSLLHKCNGWAMCIYGNWPFTLPGYDETTLSVDSYFFNPATGLKEPYRFVHRNIRAEFLPQLIQYANARGVKIYAYIGKNTFNGTYGRKHPEANAGGAAELIPFAPGVSAYWDAFIRRIVQLGFDGFVFEDPEAYHVPNQNQQCYDTFWAPWASKYGYSSVSQTDQNNPPLGVHIEYYTWLFRQFDQVIQTHAQEFGRQVDIYLISHVLLSRIMTESANDAERSQWFALVDQKQGRPVPFIISEANEANYARFFGGDRIASLGGRGGSCTCAMKRIASINNNWSCCGMSADLSYERDCQRRIFQAGGFGAMGYIFEWTNTEVFGYMAAQYLWRSAGVPGVVEDQVGFLKYAYKMHYGAEVGELVARAMDEGPCVNDQMVLEGVYGSQYPDTGKPLHRDFQYLAVLADHGLDLATQAYRLYTGQEPDLYHPVYSQDGFRWNGFDQQANKAFDAERLRLLCVSNKRSQLMCAAVLAHRKAVLLKSQGVPSSQVLAQLDMAIAAAVENQRLYQSNYDDDYDWTDGLCARLTDQLRSERNQYAAYGGFTDAAPTLHIPWEKQSDIVPASNIAQGPGLYLVTDVGLNSIPDFFCTGAVFTVQIDTGDGIWRTIYRRGLNRRITAWDHWEIPLDAAIIGSPLVKFRFLSDSYSRAQDRNTPSWKWAFWGSPQLVSIAADGSRSLLYDFTANISEARPFVRLDSDGLDRPFDGIGQDTTGATFKRSDTAGLGAIMAGEGSAWQWVEGFESIQPSSNVHSGQYLCFLGSAASWWGYGGELGEVAWLTVPIPQARETAVVFIGGTDYSAGRAELWCNGSKLLTFDTGRSSDAIWKANGVELRFIFGGDTHNGTIPYGLSGFFVLHLPASQVSAGQPISIKVKMLSGPGWFMLHDFRDILQIKSGIEAFTPHINGAFGLTGADYDVTALGDLHGQALISGRVSNALGTPWAGQPIVDATVEAVGTSASTTSDADGRYYLLVPAGTYTIRADKANYKPLRIAMTAAANDRLARDFDLHLSGGVITGTIRKGDDPAKPPVLGATVRLMEASVSTTSASDGSYTLMAPAGKWTLEASKANCRPQQADVTVFDELLISKDIDLLSSTSKWDLVPDFSGTTNPNGQWAYGGGSGSSFVPYTYKVTWAGIGSIEAGDVDGWDRAGGNSLNSYSGYPCWVRNKTGADFVNPWACTMYTDRLYCYPYFATPGVARWTAPFAGPYSIDASFVAAETSIAPTAGVTVYTQSRSVNWSSPLIGLHASQSMQAANVQLAAGENVYFEINGGTDLGITGDSADLKASITSGVDLNGKSRITGTVRQAPDTPSPGLPVGGALVELVGTTSFTTTAADGTYTLDGDPGTHTARVSKTTYSPRTFNVSMTADQILARDVEISFLNPKWDVLADFSGSNNPNNAWGYGYLDGDTYSPLLFPCDWQTGSFAPTGSTDGWDRGGNTLNAVPTGYPCIVRNKSGSDIALYGGAVNFPADRLFMTPYMALPAVVIWTAPVEGDYSIAASFRSLQTGGTSAEVAVYSSDGELSWRSRFPTAGVQSMSAKAIHLLRSDTISFENNDGGDGSCAGDEVGLQAIIQLVPAVRRLADIRTIEDGMTVAFTTSKVVTAASGTFADGSVFVEEPDRTDGVRILPRPGLPALALGSSVTFTGLIATDNCGECYIDVVSVDSSSTGPAPGPLGTPGAAVLASTEPNAAGLLVRIWGKVTSVGADGSYVYLADGSGAQDSTGQTGVRVILNATLSPITRIPQSGQYVAVTGIVAHAKIGSTVVPAIQPRSDDDIQTW